MNIHCLLELCYDSSKQAKQIFNSVHVDDTSFMDSHRKQNKIQTHIQTTSIPSILHTVDDFLACVGVAEKIIEKRND